MPLDRAQMRQYLKEFDFKNLFIEGLGWDRTTLSLPIAVNGQTFTLSAVANKRGMTAYLCSPAADGRVPDYATQN